MDRGRSAAVVQRVGVPVQLHLVIDPRGRPEREQADRGAAVQWAYSDPTDRPTDFGAGTQCISSDTLRQREATGSVRFVIDPAGPSRAGTEFLPPPRPPVLATLRSVTPTPLGTAAGLWAAITADTVSPGRSLMLRSVRWSLPVVLARDPRATAAAIRHALGDRPHPTIFVVERPGGLPRPWRAGAQAAIEAAFLSS